MTEPTTDPELRAQLAAAIAALGKSEAAIARVRALHQPRPNGTCAARCYNAGIAPEPWPCPTIRALDQPAPAATQTTDRA